MSKNQSREWIVSYTIVPNPADTKYNTHFIVRDDSPATDSIPKSITNDTDNSKNPAAASSAEKLKGKSATLSRQQERKKKKKKSLPSISKSKEKRFSYQHGRQHWVRWHSRQIYSATDTYPRVLRHRYQSVAFEEGCYDMAVPFGWNCQGRKSLCPWQF